MEDGLSETDVNLETGDGFTDEIEDGFTDEIEDGFTDEISFEEQEMTELSEDSE